MGEFKDVQEELQTLREACRALESEKQGLIDMNEGLSQAIEKANQVAMDSQMANMAKSDFVARMSQNIKVPMNRIVSFLDLMEETGMDALQADYLEHIRQGAETLLATINSVVDFSKMGAGHIHVSEIDFDLEMLAYDVCDLTIIKLENKPVELTCRVSDTLPALVKGDPQRLRQVLDNLLDNAAKFTDAGKIEFSVEAEELPDDGTLRLIFRVQDSGIGIKRKKLPTIFEAFKSADPSKRSRRGGMGLGLSLCREIARLMEGEIEVESKLKQGSTFTFTVPVKQVPVRQKARMGPVSLKGCRVLVVDEDPAALSAVKRMLESFGMLVTTLTEGGNAISQLEAAAAGDAPVDVCAVCLELNDVNPFDLAKRIQELNFSQPLLLATSTSVDVVRECRDAGFNGFLPKPLYRKKLSKMMEHLMWQKRENRQNGLVTQYTIREDAKHSVSMVFVQADAAAAAHTKEMLSRAGYLAEVVGSNAAVVSLTGLKPDGVDMVWLDHNEADAAARLIRKHAGEDLPIIATGPTSGSALSDCLEVPIDRPSVYGMVRKWVLERP